MSKNKKLHQWLWRWHFIAGIISLPFVLMLSITGGVYLFQPDVEENIVSDFQDVPILKERISYEKQWVIAKKEMNQPPNSMILNENIGESTEFVIGRFGHKKSLFVNPYNGEVIGKFSPKDSWMYTVRKLHGELLGGKVGTKFIELIASWLVVLILTGLYIWFPFNRGLKGVLTIRFNKGKQVLYRDLHAVTGFWISILLLITLAGGFPWTDVFGGNFKRFQEFTNTGYPKTWRGKGLKSTPTKKALTLDEIRTIAKAQKLPGVVTIGLAKNEKSTFSISNRTFPLDSQKMLHFDQYSGELIKEHVWSDVGVLQRGRAWVMAFHQGQFGGWNWCLMFGLCLALTTMSSFALVHYLGRKTKGDLSIPKKPIQFTVGKGVLVLIVLLGFLFPLFGISLIVIVFFEFVRLKLIAKSFH